MIKIYTESDQRTIPFQQPKLSITQREFIWTLAKTRYEINDAVTLHNEALTVFICLMFALVKSLVIVQKLRCNDKIFHAINRLSSAQCSSLQPFM